LRAPFSFDHQQKRRDYPRSISLSFEKEIREKSETDILNNKCGERKRQREILNEYIDNVNTPFFSREK